MWNLASGLVARGREEGYAEAADDYCKWIFMMFDTFGEKPWVESDLRLFAKEKDIPDYAISKIIDAAKQAKICMD